jgi:hypothetical protein
MTTFVTQCRRIASEIQAVQEDAKARAKVEDRDDMDLGKTKLEKYLRRIIVQKA